MTTRQLAIRQAEPADIPTLVSLRLALLRDLGDPAIDSDIAQASAAIRGYLERKLPTDGYVAWLAELDGNMVATASLVVMEKMPTLHNTSGREAYLMSVYTLPAYRRLGAAESLVRSALDYARAKGIRRVSLHASDQGRPLYERLGFTHMGHEMRWVDQR